MRKIIVLYLLFFFIFGTHPVYAKETRYRFSEITNRNGNLVFTFRIKDFITKDVLEGLQKGMTAAVEFQIQLWRARRNWIDQLVTDKSMRMRIVYDNWEKRYIVSTQQDEDIRMNEDGVQRFCSELVEYELEPLSSFRPDKQYYIGVRAVLQPLSIENIQGIKRWLTGEVKDLNPKAIKSTKSAGKKAGDWLLDVVLNLTGFGDRLIEGKSRPFTVNQDTVVVQEED